MALNDRMETKVLGPGGAALQAKGEEAGRAAVLATWGRWQRGFGRWAGHAD